MGRICAAVFCVHLCIRDSGSIDGFCFKGMGKEMKKLVFESGDFFINPNLFGYTPESVMSEYVRYAQAKFDEWWKKEIESAPLVYGRHPAPQEYIGNWANKETDCDTHTARLILIEEIKKECVKHIAKFDRQQNTYFCENCGTELYAEWKVKP